MAHKGRLIAIGFGVVGILIVATLLRYQTEYSGMGTTLVIDRWTGSYTLCNNSLCVCQNC